LCCNYSYPRSRWYGITFPKGSRRGMAIRPMFFGFLLSVGCQIAIAPNYYVVCE